MEVGSESVKVLIKGLFDRADDDAARNADECELVG